MVQEIETFNLRACPFCGGKAELKVADHPFGDCLVVRVNCSECHCESNSYQTGMTLGFPGHPSRNVMLGEAKEKAREAWNRRPNFGQRLKKEKGREEAV